MESSSAPPWNNALEQHPDAVAHAKHLPLGQPRDVLVGHENLARVGPQQPSDQAQ
jgi:hypothetical protein